MPLSLRKNSFYQIFIPFIDFVGTFNQYFLDFINYIDQICVLQRDENSLNR